MYSMCFLSFPLSLSLACNFWSAGSVDKLPNIQFEFLITFIHVISFYLPFPLSLHVANVICMYVSARAIFVLPIFSHISAPVCPFSVINISTAAILSILVALILVFSISQSGANDCTIMAVYSIRGKCVDVLTHIKKAKLPKQMPLNSICLMEQINAEQLNFYYELFASFSAQVFLLLCCRRMLLLLMMLF